MPKIINSASVRLDCCFAVVRCIFTRVEVVVEKVEVYSELTVCEFLCQIHQLVWMAATPIKLEIDDFMEDSSRASTLRKISFILSKDAGQ